MKVVHINKKRIQQDDRVQEMSQLLVEKWTRRNRARLLKKNRLSEESLQNNDHQREPY